MIYKPSKDRFLNVLDVPRFNNEAYYLYNSAAMTHLISSRWRQTEIKTSMMYVTYRRSLGPDLKWFARYWGNAFKILWKFQTCSRIRHAALNRPPSLRNTGENALCPLGGGRRIA